MASILIVDDNQDIRELNKLVLEMAGHTALTVSSGLEALQVLKDNSGFDLVISDVNMDEMTGFEFLIQFEIDMPVLFSTLPVVLHSAAPISQASKAAGFILKGCGIDEIISNVNRFLVPRAA